MKEEDVAKDYVEWFKNKKVVKFSENQNQKLTLSKQKKYVNSCLKNKDVDLYGIFDDKKHIGNILIIGLRSKHKVAEITYIIGDTSYWGKGVGTFAISEIISLAKLKYKLRKLSALVADKNYGSKKVLEKNGFVLEGIRKKHLVFNKKVYNQLDYGLIFQSKFYL